MVPRAGRVIDRMSGITPTGDFRARVRYGWAEGSMVAAPRSLPAGNYVQCQSCGKVLRVLCATRSMVCSCGARLPPQPSAGRSPAAEGPPARKG